jgi:outer membrane protein OmpA-like peptidoglycan-associated protein
MSAEYLVRNVLLQEGSGLLIQNVSFKGRKESIARFWNESPEELIDEGIILSTGDVFDAKGPNDAMNTGKRASGLRDDNLQAIATGVVTDAVILEFDLLALKDSIEFTYVFASEEYPEYVDMGVNDVFGFFVKEIGGRAINPINIARLPNQKQTVSIDNVNHRRNREYFLMSDFLEAHSLEFWEKQPRMFMRANIFQFDGFTVPLKASIRLKEGKSYHLKIAIADVGDRLYDSAVLLKARSMRSSGQPIAQADSIVKEILLREMDLDSVVSGGDRLSFSLIVHFNTNEAIILEESFEELHQLIQLLKDFADLQVEIIGHTDSDGSTADNLVLSDNRAEAVKNFLLFHGEIDPTRLKTAGMGESQPVASNLTEEGKAQNRRVEFRVRYR